MWKLLYCQKTNQMNVKHFIISNALAGRVIHIKQQLKHKRGDDDNNNGERMKEPHTNFSKQ